MAEDKIYSALHWAMKAKKSAEEAANTSIIGVVLSYAGDTPPVGWLMCDGSEVSREIYSNLFSVIGTKYGNGDGSSTFNLPNYTDEAICHYPDFSRISGLELNQGQQTATESGYISMVGRAAAGGDRQLTETVGLLIENVPVFTWGGQNGNSTDSNGGMFSIKKGQKYELKSPTVGALSTYWCNFIPEITRNIAENKIIKY